MAKLAFKPRITRVRLNPEQAVLACNCSTTGTNLFSEAGGNYISGGGVAACVEGGKSLGMPLVVIGGGYNTRPSNVSS